MFSNGYLYRPPTGSAPLNFEGKQKIFYLSFEKNETNFIMFVNLQQDASGGNATSNVGASSNLSNTKDKSKNGNIFSDGMILATTKQLTKKDKRGSSAALQAFASIDTSDATYLDKSSPLLQTKRKSSSIDMTLNGPSIDLMQISSFANGNSVINEEIKPSPTSANGEYMPIESNLTDTNSDLSSIISEHNNSNKSANVSTTANNNMQISQV